MNFNDEDVDFAAIPLWNQTSDFDVDEPMVTADLSDIIKQLRELEMDEAEAPEKRAVLNAPLMVDGGVLYIDELQFMFYKDSPDKDIEDLVIEGYYVY